MENGGTPGANPSAKVQINQGIIRYLFDWNPDRVQELIALWLEGRTSGQIARAFGTSRSTIMGKVHRLRNAGILTDGGRRKPPKPVQRKRGATLTHPSRRKKKLTLEPPKKVLPPQPVVGGISIVDLEGYHCRAIVGKGADGLARYCGAPKEPHFLARINADIKTSYCGHHNGLYHNQG